MKTDESNKENEAFENELVRDLNDYLFLDSRRYESEMRGDE